MKTNMGNFDRFFRILLAVTIAILYSSNLITDMLAIVLLVVAIAFVITSFIGFCPMYLPFGFSSKRNKNTRAA